jgi:hypothetical protein
MKGIFHNLHFISNILGIYIIKRKKKCLLLNKIFKIYKILQI